MVLLSPGLGKESIVINHKSIQVSLQVGGTAQDGPVGRCMEVCYANALEQATRQVMRQAARSLPTEYGMFGYNEDEAFQELLRRSGPHPHEKVLRVVAGTCSSQFLMRLIECGADPSLKDAQDRTAWQTAAYEKSRNELIVYQSARKLLSSAVSPLDGMATRSIRETTLPDRSSSRSCR